MALLRRVEDMGEEGDPQDSHRTTQVGGIDELIRGGGSLAAMRSTALDLKQRERLAAPFVDR